jgi:pimeloyl-ACP methyl ester carboxylesterase
VPRIRPALKALQCPTLIIAGEQSQILTPETLSWLKGLNKRLTTASLPGGHLLPLESPAICAEAVATFIGAQEASQRP